MRKLVISAAIVACLAASAAFAQQPANPPADNPIPPSKAKLYIDYTEFNFGYLPNDASVGHAFVFYSKGQDSLKILRVKPG